MPWGPAPKGIMSKAKDFLTENMWPTIRKSGEGFGQTIKRYANPKSYFRGDSPPMQRFIRNITLPQIYHGFTGDDKRSTGIDVMASEIPDSWDRDPVTFDPYIQERMNRMEAPRDDRRGPGPWNEFRG